MSLITSKMLLANNPVTLGGEGSAYTAMQSNVFAGAGNFLLPLGDWWIVPDATVSVQITTDGGTTWLTIIAAGGSGFIRSDGVSVRLVATAASTAQFFGPA